MGRKSQDETPNLPVEPQNAMSPSSGIRRRRRRTNQDVGEIHLGILLLQRESGQKNCHIALRNLHFLFSSVKDWSL